MYCIICFEDLIRDISHDCEYLKKIEICIHGIKNIHNLQKRCICIYVFRSSWVWRYLYYLIIELVLLGVEDFLVEVGPTGYRYYPEQCNSCTETCLVTNTIEQLSDKSANHNTDNKCANQPLHTYVHIFYRYSSVSFRQLCIVNYRLPSFKKILKIEEEKS